MDRRSFLRLAGGGAAGAAATSLLAPALVVRGPAGTPAGGPFALGVASGDPWPGSVVLWTRLAAEPLTPGGGMARRVLPVGWEVAADERFRRVVRRGEAWAGPGAAHSVHVEVGGLAPGATYWYRFRSGRDLSPVGRTRTAPAADAPAARVRLAVASCQNWQDGWFTAHRALAGEDVDAVVFLGDYIYESLANARSVRIHERDAEPVTLEDYRIRHALYRTDPDLQACHAAHPWVVALDDHEVDNNWAGPMPQDPEAQDHGAFHARRAAALRAHWEHMPLRWAARPSGAAARLHRRLAWGDLVQLDVLDTRQHRSDQALHPAGTADPTVTMLGADQERWLAAGLAGSTARWNAVAQQTMVAPNDRRAGPGVEYDPDSWDGYRSPRRRLLAALGGVPNPVVLSGDRHCTWACDLTVDPDDPSSEVVAAELATTSISSGGDDSTERFHADYDPVAVESPHWKLLDNRRGYLLCDIDRDRWQTDLRVVSTVRAPEATVSTFATLVTGAGRRGVEVVAAPDEAVPARWPREQPVSGPGGGALP